MKTKKEMIETIKRLKKEYPEAKCSLNFKTPFELGIAVMLSAQCTDERVNKIVPLLFNKYDTPKKIAKIDIKELEKIIYPCGFYKNKSKNVIAYSKKILEDFGGELPQTMEELITLPGIGRKSANVIMLNAFNTPVGIAVDTHAKRICNRIGISSNSDPNKIEQDLLEIVPKEYLKDVNHLFVYHGREFCISRKPKCEKCPINKMCDYYLNLK